MRTERIDPASDREGATSERSRAFQLAGAWMMVDVADARYEQWVRDGEVLAQIGRVFFAQSTRVSVRLPRTLAEEALASWQRETENEPPLPSETPEQQAARYRAAALGLIGLSMESSGVADGDEVVVDVDASQIRDAIRAADEDGLLRDARPPRAQ